MLWYSSDNDAGSYTLSARNKCGFSSGYVDIGMKGTAIARYIQLASYKFDTIAISAFCYCIVM